MRTRLPQRDLVSPPGALSTRAGCGRRRATVPCPWRSPIRPPSETIPAKTGDAPSGARLGSDEARALRERLKVLPRFYRHYGGWKVRLDPVYPLLLAELAGAKEILDLGAGMGLFEALVAERFPGARVRGVEWDERKVAMARLLLANLPGATVEQGDALKADPDTPDAILLIDLLHYMPRDVQRSLLDRCARALAPGGRLFVRELDTARTRRSTTERIERMAVRFGWNRGAGVSALPAEEMATLLRALGLAVSVRPCGRGLFSSNYLLVARKEPT